MYVFFLSLQILKINNCRFMSFNKWKKNIKPVARTLRPVSYTQQDDSSDSISYIGLVS